MSPSRQPLQQISQASRSANLPDPKSTKKPKPDALAPQNQNNKVHKPLPASKPKPDALAPQNQSNKIHEPLSASKPDALAPQNQSNKIHIPSPASKPKPDALPPHNKNNKLPKPLPAFGPTLVFAPVRDQLKRGLEALAKLQDILPQDVSTRRWEEEHENDLENKTKLWAWPRFNLNEGWRLLNERQQQINEWKASGSLSALHKRLLNKFEALQPNTARQIWLTVQQERRWIEADIKRWNEGPMPLTEPDQRSRDLLNEQMAGVEMAETYIYGVYKPIVEPLIEAEKLAREKERLDKEEMDKMVEDAYQAILAAEAEELDKLVEEKYRAILAEQAYQRVLAEQARVANSRA